MEELFEKSGLEELNDAPLTREAVDEDLLLINKIVAGDAELRKIINARIHPMIMATNQRVCKTYCLHHRYEYKCTIDESWSKNNTDTLYCEWGNASYAWILDDLTNNKRLSTFKGGNGVLIEAYLGTIVSSMPFLERWREWRFGRRIKVPKYIQEIHEYAPKVFFSLLAKDEIPNIAQQLNLAEEQVKKIRDSIIIELTQRGRLHVLDAPEFISLDADYLDSDKTSSKVEYEVASYDLSIDQREDREKLGKAWQSLTAEEQFVLEAMKIDNQDAKAVLKTLKHFNISIKDGVTPDNTSEQQLYYFMRKSWKKLSMNSELLA